MTIQIHEQLPSDLAPLPGVTLSAGVQNSIELSRKAAPLHARLPRREMQQKMRFSQGKVLFPTDNAGTLDADIHDMDIHDMDIHDYVVTAGEVVILQDGQPVDLIEAGEWFTAWLWDGAEIVANTDCAIQVVQPQRHQNDTKERAHAAATAEQPSPVERMNDFLAHLAGILAEPATCQPA